MLKFLKNQKNAEKKQDISNSSPSKRFLAYGIDCFIVTLIRYIFGIILFYVWFKKSLSVFLLEYGEHFSALNTYFPGTDESVKFFMQHSIFIEVLFIVFLTFISASFYWILLPLSKFGATPGKRLMKMKIINRDGSKFKISDSIKRYVVGLVPWGFCFASIIGIVNQNVAAVILPMVVVTFWYEPGLLKRTNRSVHDFICNTQVIKII
jgi:uncharacterized RDD family membrane protein YckC